MKTVFTKREGVSINSSIDFGSTENISHEFVFLLKVFEYHWKVNISYHYRTTDDGYIQLATQDEKKKYHIVAQIALRFECPKIDKMLVLFHNFLAQRSDEYKPMFLSSPILTEEDFSNILDEVNNRRDENIRMAEAKQNRFIDYLQKQGFKPQADGCSVHTWTACCPNGEGHHKIAISTQDDSWHCPLCEKKGNQQALDKWLMQLRMHNDQKKISKMLKELDKHGRMVSPDVIGWWMNRY
ncbi:MAG: hypothetical protein RQ735_09510 [Flavobacteriaceae bacterium]|nr:hypothetical protein [Flavobacteriaceae bacterium]